MLAVPIRPLLCHTPAPHPWQPSRLLASAAQSLAATACTRPRAPTPCCGGGWRGAGPVHGLASGGQRQRQQLSASDHKRKMCTRRELTRACPSCQCPPAPGWAAGAMGPPAGCQGGAYRRRGREGMAVAKPPGSCWDSGLHAARSLGSDPKGNKGVSGAKRLLPSTHHPGSYHPGPSICCMPQPSVTTTSATHLATSSMPRISRPIKKAGSRTAKVSVVAPLVKVRVSSSSCSRGGGAAGCTGSIEIATQQWRHQAGTHRSCGGMRHATAMVH